MQVSFWLPFWALVAWKWAGAAFGGVFLMTALMAAAKRARARWVIATLLPLLAWTTFFVVRGLAAWPR